MSLENKTKISKQMAYLLRHDPSGMEISDEGFVPLPKLLSQLRERWPELRREDVRDIVETDPKGRYEIWEEKIRARYGHSIDVDPSLNEAEEDVLYHGTTSEASKKILEEGLKPKGRQKVHLSKDIEDAMEVGRRRAKKPVILEVDVSSAEEAGIEVERASDKVYVADRVPPEFISLRNETD